MPAITAALYAAAEVRQKDRHQRLLVVILAPQSERAGGPEHMSVYLVARGRISDQEMHDEYVARAVETIPSDARIVAFDLASEVVEGDPADERTVIIEFPSREAFRAWYDSAVYQEVLPLRLNSVPGALAVVDAYVPEA